MDLLPVAFIVIVVLTGGVTGYLADHAGKKLGKKRLSFMGLRPRHTAALGTILLGMLISIVTIGLVALFSSGVRDWITKGRSALVDLQRTQGELSTEQSNLKATQAKSELYQTQIKVLQAQIRRGGDTLASQKTKIDDLNLRQGVLQNRVTDISRKVKTKDSQIHQAAQRLVDSKKRLDENNHHLDQIKQSLSTTQRDLKVSVKERNDSLTEKLQIDLDNARLKRSIDEQKTTLTALQTQKSDLAQQKDQLEKDLESSQINLNALRRDLATETERLSETKQLYAEWQHQAADFFKSSFIPSRTLPMIYRIGQELTRLPVPPHLSQAKAEATLDSLLTKARLEASQHGALGHKSRQADYASADIYDRNDGVTAAEIKKALVQELTGQESEQVLIARAGMNTFEKEPVPLDLDIKPNPLVYAKNQIVDEAVIDGSLPPEAILQQLSTFVGTHLKEKAKKDQMIPEDGSFGSLPGYQVHDLLTELQKANRPIRVQALATTDTRAADPLKLEFRIR